MSLTVIRQWLSKVEKMFLPPPRSLGPPLKPEPPFAERLSRDLDALLQIRCCPGPLSMTLEEFEQRFAEKLRDDEIPDLLACASKIFSESPTQNADDDDLLYGVSFLVGACLAHKESVTVPYLLNALADESLRPVIVVALSSTIGDGMVPIIEAAVPLVGRMADWEQGWFLDAFAQAPPGERARLRDLLWEQESSLTDPERERLRGWRAFVAR